MSYFNEDQRDYMRMLENLAPERKCACRWYPRGECEKNCWTGVRLSQDKRRYHNDVADSSSADPLVAT